VRLWRDAYYVAFSAERQSFSSVVSDFDTDVLSSSYGLAADSLADFLSDPQQWDRFDERRTVEFQLGPDEFFFLGDNSTQSKDGRLWPMEGLPHYVCRDQLVGKAILRYFPRQGIVR
jgi:hypothetical protein